MHRVSHAACVLAEGCCSCSAFPQFSAANRYLSGLCGGYLARASWRRCVPIRPNSLVGKAHKNRPLAQSARGPAGYRGCQPLNQAQAKQARELRLARFPRGFCSASGCRLGCHGGVAHRLSGSGVKFGNCVGQSPSSFAFFFGEKEASAPETCPRVFCCVCGS